ncbi:HAD family phosphatase [Actinomyces ruminicola]|uniref:HAD family hydrolase n=1 Tax=Actinomyces ruminicola TaxID=332524 RepID=UPI00164F0593|nr:HAD-IB family hydrolase [Actinomyces ruminicola]
MSVPELVLVDVDETLIKVKSMFSFLDHVLRYQGWGTADRDLALERFSRLSRNGASREEVNKAYYRGFAGYSRAWLLKHGEQWYAERGNNLYNEQVRKEIAELHSRGATIALVSGSFDACLLPIAREVNAEHVLGTVPIDTAGVYTGMVSRPMIGEEKGKAARELMDSLGISEEGVRAYGDHPSDIPLLNCAKDVIVVGANSEMRRYAQQRGLRTI